MAGTIVLTCTYCGNEFIRWRSKQLSRKSRKVFCSMEHRRAFEDSYFINFWDYVDKSGGEEACWPWQGRRGYRGYGTLSYRRLFIYAHRRAYELTHGATPADRPEIRHKCDFPPCCNPRHLVPGTHAENGRDMAERERSPTTKLTASQVIAIRADPRSDAVVGKEYGISRTGIYNVRKRNSWRHIP